MVGSISPKLRLASCYFIRQRRHSISQSVYKNRIWEEEMVVYDEPDRMLRISEVAEILHVYPTTLRIWSKQGIIGTYRIGPRGDRRFRQSDIESFIAQSNPFKQNGTSFTG
jgi:excisionase family DNA binding protein